MSKNERDAARREVITLIKKIGEFARGSAQNGNALSKEERAELFIWRRQMAHAVREVAKVIGKNPHDHVQEHALIHLRQALAAAFMIGRGATVSPTVQRQGNAKAATGREARAVTSRQIDKVIIAEVEVIAARRPDKRNNTAFLAQQLAKSAALKEFKLKEDALKKRLRKLRK